MTYIQIHDNECINMDKQMQWLLSYTEGVATDCAQPLMKALLNSTNWPELVNMDALHNSFISHFRNLNAVHTAE